MQVRIGELTIQGNVEDMVRFCVAYQTAIANNAGQNPNGQPQAPPALGAPGQAAPVPAAQVPAAPPVAQIPAVPSPPVQPKTEFKKQK